jgi:enoyl-[acyl-carrier protein] reductase I
MLNINLKGKKAFIAGIGDDQGFGFQIAKILAEAGCEIIIGTWAPILNIFLNSWKLKKFDESRKLKDGSLFNYSKVYPIDASFDTMDDVPEDIKQNKRYKELNNYAIKDVANLIEKDYGKIDILVHSLANAPEVTKPLLETSRDGYLKALNASSYSFVSLVRHFSPIMNNKGSILALSYIASTKAVPGYGGGMSSAKAALESDIRTLAYEAGRKYNLRLNCISAGPLRSRAAKAIGMIDDMIKYSLANAPLQKDLLAEDVANLAAFLSSDLASSITADTIFVDNGLHAMGMAVDSKSIQK